MCGVCEQFGLNIHADAELNGGGGEGGGGGDLSAPTESFTIAEAAAHLNRINASWVQDAEGNPILGSATTVTYAFRSSETALGDDFSRFNANQIVAAQLALQSWADVANISFTRVAGEGPGGAYSNNASILFSNQDAPSGAAWGAYASPPWTANRSASSNEGNVHVNSDIAANLDPKLFEYGLGTLTTSWATPSASTIPATITPARAARVTTTAPSSSRTLSSTAS